MALQIWRPREISARWPFSESDWDRWLGDFFNRPVYRRTPLMETEWNPSMEMFEQEDKFVIKAELPGVKKEDVEVSVSDSMLTVKGKREASKEVKDEDYYFSESSYGSFTRSINLPRDADTGDVEANMNNGVLEITMPKRQEAKSKKIKVGQKKVVEGKP